MTKRKDPKDYKKTGRPTKYDEAMCRELDKYLATTGKLKKNLPTLFGFALWLKVDTDTLNEWSKIHPVFSVALTRLKHVQATQLINDGMYERDVNPTIVKLLLQNNHGMRERNDLTTNDKPIPAPIYGGLSKNE